MREMVVYHYLSRAWELEDNNLILYKRLWAWKKKRWSNISSQSRNRTSREVDQILLRTWGYPLRTHNTCRWQRRRSLRRINRAFSQRYLEEVARKTRKRTKERRWQWSRRPKTHVPWTWDLQATSSSKIMTSSSNNMKGNRKSSNRRQRTVQLTSQWLMETKRWRHQEGRTTKKS